MHYAAKYAMRELLEKFLYIGAIRGNPEMPNLEGKNCLHLVCSKLTRSNYQEQALTNGFIPAAVNGSASKEEAQRRAECLEILLNWTHSND